MKKSKEHIVYQDNNYQVVFYTYYFKTMEECNSYILKDDEQLLYVYKLMDENSDFKIGVNIKKIRIIQDNKIYNFEEYAAFVKNLQNTQHNFGYSNEWYNNWIDYVNKIPYDEAIKFIELLNDFYITGKEGVW